MQNGRYRLEETTVPNGYIIQTECMYFSVNDGAITLTNVDGEETTYTWITLEDDDTTIAIANTPGIELPKTGGMGTEVFTALGGAMTAAAGAMLLRRKKKKTEEA